MRTIFCTTCYNRLWQLQQTFERNAAFILDSANAEWVILNYNTTSDIHEFMLHKLEVASPRVVYAYGSKGLPWHLSIAKNIAHRIVTGEVLVNLDCDNIIDDAGLKIGHYFAQGCKVLHLWSGLNRDGTCGRIAIDAGLFACLRGYNEEFYPMGYQDLDLLARARAVGVPVVECAPTNAVALPNTKFESVLHCRQGDMSWADFDTANRAMSAMNLAAGRLTASNAYSDVALREIRLLRGQLSGDRNASRKH